MDPKTKEIIVHSAIGVAAVATSVVFRFLPGAKEKLMTVGTETFKLVQNATKALAESKEESNV
jgi:hypothetical protein